LKKAIQNWKPTDWLLLGLVCLLMFGKRLVLLDTQLNPEEGKEIDSILNILNGKLVYRDFYWQYGLGGPYLLAFLSNLIGSTDITLPRLVVSIVAAGTTFFSYLVARFYIPPLWAFWATLLSSSGLAAREHSYGHGFAYLGMIASLFFLVKFIKLSRVRYRDLVFSGLFASLPCLFKPVVFGVGAVTCGILCLALSAWIYQEKNCITKNLCAFSLPVLMINLPIYGYLFINTSLELLYVSLYPMSSGGVTALQSYGTKSLLPAFLFSPTASWTADLNNFLNDNVRYWTVIFTTIGGVVFIAKKMGSTSPLKKYLLLIILILYGTLIEVETILWPDRPITFYINMLPSYILLALFFQRAMKVHWISTIVYSISLLMCIYYFFYPAVTLGVYYKSQGETLDLPFAQNIRVPKYTKAGYHNVTNYIQQKTRPDQSIVNADYNSFLYLFSNRTNLFWDDFLIFGRTPFHPFQKNNTAYPKSFYEKIENKIIERIEREKPAMILIPSEYITDKSRQNSVFIQYLLTNWEPGDVLNSQLVKGPFDKKDLKIETFFPKTDIVIQ
jgi:hypothetical protein